MIYKAVWRTVGILCVVGLVLALIGATLIWISAGDVSWWSMILIIVGLSVFLGTVIGSIGGRILGWLGTGFLMGVIVPFFHGAFLGTIFRLEVLEDMIWVIIVTSLVAVGLAAVGKGIGGEIEWDIGAALGAIIVGFSGVFFYWDGEFPLLTLFVIIGVTVGASSGVIIGGWSKSKKEIIDHEFKYLQKKIVDAEENIKDTLQTIDEDFVKSGKIRYGKCDLGIRCKMLYYRWQNFSYDKTELKSLRVARDHINKLESELNQFYNDMKASVEAERTRREDLKYWVEGLGVYFEVITDEMTKELFPIYEQHQELTNDESIKEDIWKTEQKIQRLEKVVEEYEDLSTKDTEAGQEAKEQKKDVEDELEGLKKKLCDLTESEVERKKNIEELEDRAKAIVLQHTSKLSVTGERPSEENHGGPEGSKEKAAGTSLEKEEASRDLPEGDLRCIDCGTPNDPENKHCIGCGERMDDTKLYLDEGTKEY